MKISTNSQFAFRKPKWIDFDAGVLLNDNIDADVVLVDLIARIVQVAGGSLLNHESVGAKEIAIFKTGVTL